MEPNVKRSVTRHYPLASAPRVTSVTPDAQGPPRGGASSEVANPSERAKNDEEGETGPGSGVDELGRVAGGVQAEEEVAPDEYRVHQHHGENEVDQLALHPAG